MKLNTVFFFTSVLTFVGGWVIIFFARQLMEFFTGRPLTDEGPILYIQWFGVALLTFSVMTWLARRLSTADARRTILITMFAYCLLGTVVTGLFQFKGALNGWGWFFPGHLAVLGLCYAYYLFLRKDLIAPPVKS